MGEEVMASAAIGVLMQKLAIGADIIKSKPIVASTSNSGAGIPGSKAGASFTDTAIIFLRSSDRKKELTPVVAPSRLVPAGSGDEPLTGADCGHAVRRKILEHTLRGGRIHPETYAISWTRQVKTGRTSRPRGWSGRVWVCVGRWLRGFTGGIPEVLQLRAVMVVVDEEAPVRALVDVLDILGL